MLASVVLRVHIAIMRAETAVIQCQAHVKTLQILQFIWVGLDKLYGKGVTQLSDSYRGMSTQGGMCNPL